VLRLHYDLAFVEHGPLPPHERTWRHPSELAAEQHALARSQTTTSTTRMFAITSGTLGLLAVGLLMMAVTPSRSGSPVAISATTTPVSAAETVAVIATIATGTPDRAPLGLRGRAEVLATPIGEGHFAVITAVDLAIVAGAADLGAAVEVEVPSGHLRAARVVGRSGDAVLVELERAEPGVEIADEHPAGHEIVTVLAQPPVTIVLDDLPELEVEEGTAVLDGDGELVGLCSQHRDETRLLRVGDAVVERDARDDDRDEDDGRGGTVSDERVGATNGG
jgi:hypothetical protein